MGYITSINKLHMNFGMTFPISRITRKKITFPQRSYSHIYTFELPFWKLSFPTNHIALLVTQATMPLAIVFQMTAIFKFTRYPCIIF